MTLKSEHSSFLDKLDAQLVLGKRGRKRHDKKVLKKEQEQIAKKEKIIDPEDLIKPEDLEEPIPEEEPEQTFEMKEDSKDLILAKLEKISDPKLLIINSKVSDTLAEDDEQETDTRRQAYREFLSDKGEILKTCINLTNEDDVHVWIVDGGVVKDLDDGLRYHQVAGSFSNLPDDLLTHEAPFDDVKVKVKGVDKDMMRDDLSQLWIDIVGEPEEDEDITEEEPDGEDQTDQESTEGEEDQEGGEFNDDDKILETLPEPEVDEVDDSVNIAKIKKLKNPYLFVLSPIDPDKYNDFVSSSKILPKLQKSTMFLESGDKKKVGTTQKGISVYFVGENDVSSLKGELKQSNPSHILGPLLDKDETFDDFLNQDTPFSGLNLAGTKLSDKLVAELNAKWRRHTSESSGNVMPAVQINTMVPLNYLRFLNNNQRKLQIYLGDRPSGAGMSGAAYILANEAEAIAYVNLMKKYKMPTLFYKHLYADSDIDPRFKKTPPETFTPSNVLVMWGDFDPNKEVQLTEDNKDLVRGDKATQLELLHGFAKKELKNPTSNAGSFVKSQYFVGTTVAHFNANMSICFLWGSITQSVTLNKAKVLKQLPFVAKLITSYL